MENYFKNLKKEMFILFYKWVLMYNNLIKYLELEISFGQELNLMEYLKKDEKMKYIYEKINI